MHNYRDSTWLYRYMMNYAFIQIYTIPWSVGIITNYGQPFWPTNAQEMWFGCINDLQIAKSGWHEESFIKFFHYIIYHSNTNFLNSSSSLRSIGQHRTTIDNRKKTFWDTKVPSHDTLLINVGRIFWWDSLRFVNVWKSDWLTSLPSLERSHIPYQLLPLSWWFSRIAQVGYVSNRSLEGSYLRWFVGRLFLLHLPLRYWILNFFRFVYWKGSFGEERPNKHENPWMIRWPWWLTATKNSQAYRAIKPVGWILQDEWRSAKAEGYCAQATHKNGRC